MGWSRTEPSTSTGPTEFSLTANNNELQRRIDQYRALYIKTENLKKQIAPGRLDAYFQLVEYPVKGATLMNGKFLDAQQYCEISPRLDIPYFLKMTGSIS